MSVSYRHSPNLPWSTLDRDERRFYLITTTVLLIALLFGLVIPVIQLPEKERFKKQTLPPRLAQLILEQKKTPPPKPKEVKKLVEEKKKEPKKEKPKEAKKPEPEKKPEPKVAKKPPKPSSVEQARKKAASAGVLAFADQLADLRDEPAIPSTAGIQKRAVTGQKATGAQRAMITSGAAKGSGGINTAALSRDTGGQGLGGRSTTQVSSSAADAQRAQTVANSKARGKNHKGNRTREEIQTVFDQNKGAVYALYNRALRKDPTLRGKVVLELTISPSGKVTKCRVVSSELNDKGLERKLVSRIKLFKFMAKDVDTAVVSYPIDFLPS